LEEWKSGWVDEEGEIINYPGFPLGLPRGGFDTARELWKESISFPPYSTTGLTLPVLA
jgi:hypothetical protein